jgi:hypothetical protein
MVLGVSTIARRRLNGKVTADREWDAIVIGEHERAFYIHATKGAVAGSGSSRYAAAHGRAPRSGAARIG